MTRDFAILFASLILICAGGCSKNNSSMASAADVAGTPIGSSRPAADTVAGPKSDEESIRAAIQQHLANNSTLNMGAMDMNVVQTSVNGDQAQADVEFRLKQGGTTMQMTYSLIRHAGGWLVTKSQPGGGQFAHPPTDQNRGATAPNSQSAAIPDVHDFFKNAPVTKPDPTAAARHPK